MLKNYLFSPLCSAPFLYSIPLFLFLSTPHLSSFFSVSVSAPLFFFFASAFLFFSIHVCPFFQPKNILFSPKQFSLQPKNIFFSPNVFQFFSPNIFQFFFSPNVFQFFSPNVFLQPKRFLLQFSHYSLLLFFALFFSGSALFFLFQRLLFFFSLAPFIQGPIFSLAASHLFYLNKSLFSSNLE